MNMNNIIKTNKYQLVICFVYIKSFSISFIIMVIYNLIQYIIIFNNINKRLK